MHICLFLGLSGWHPCFFFGEGGSLKYRPWNRLAKQIFTLFLSFAMHTGIVLRLSHNRFRPRGIVLIHCPSYHSALCSVMSRKVCVRKRPRCEVKNMSRDCVKPRKTLATAVLEYGTSVIRSRAAIGSTLVRSLPCHTSAYERSGSAVLQYRPCSSRVTQSLSAEAAPGSTWEEEAAVSHSLRNLAFTIPLQGCEALGIRAAYKTDTRHRTPWNTFASLQ
jgi:hypothetical protein